MAEQPSTEPDKQLSLASRNPISITVASSGRREGERGGQLSLLPPALHWAGTPGTQGCLVGWVPPLLPWCSKTGSQGSLEMAQSPTGYAVGTLGWHRVGAARGWGLWRRAGGAD